MFTIRRCHSVQIKRQKIYRQQPPQRTYPIYDEQQKSASLFPHRNFSKKLSLSHHKTKSHLQQKSSPQKYENTKNKFIIQNQPHLGPLLSNNTKINTNKIKQDQRSPPTFIRSSCLEPKQSGQNYELYQTHCSSKQSNRKPFLRKGSNLQKQIIINLLRNKILRDKEEQIQKEYDNDQILKMIHVFKGVAMSTSSKGKKMFEVRERKNGEQNVRELRGWQSRKEEILYNHEEKF